MLSVRSTWIDMLIRIIFNYISIDFIFYLSQSISILVKARVLLTYYTTNSRNSIACSEPLKFNCYLLLSINIILIKTSEFVKARKK